MAAPESYEYWDAIYYDKIGHFFKHKAVIGNQEDSICK